MATRADAASGTRTWVSQGQKNIVLRARQLSEIKWTPVYDRWQWNYEGVFKAGTTYTGVPYGQPLHTGYVGYDISLEGFAAAVKNGSSAFYTSYSYYNKLAPYYSIDCSGFVSYAWGLSQRRNTSGLTGVSSRVASQSVNALEIGDCLNLSGVHAVLVSDVVRNSSGNVVAVSIMEATPSITKTTRYGEGGSKSLSNLSSYYFGSGYVLYRYSGRDNVSYKHSCAVPIDGDYCSACGGSTTGYTDVSKSDWFYDAVQFVTAKGLFSGTGGAKFSPHSSMSRAMFVSVLGRMAGIDSSLSGRVGIALGDNVNIRSGPGTGYSVIGQIDYYEPLSVLDWQNGWYKVKYNGKTGYIIESYVKPYQWTFSDIDYSQYYSPYVQWAYLVGIISNNGSGSFSPNTPIKREDMAALLYDYAKLMGIGLKQSGSSSPFADDGSISAYAKTAVYAMKRAGVINGKGNGYFYPAANATRAEVAAIFKNFLNAAY